MTTKTTTSLPLGWRRYRWPLLRAQLTAHFRRLDIDPWLVLSGLVVVALVIYGRTQVPPTVAPALIVQSTSRPIVIMATVLVVPTAAPTIVPTAIPTVEPPIADEAPPAEVEPAPAMLLAALTPAPLPTAEPLGEHGQRPSNRPGPGERKTKP